MSVSAEEKELKRYYDGMKASIGPDGLIHPAHIMILVAQKATPEEQAKAKERIDSIYTALQQGADFATWPSNALPTKVLRHEEVT